MPFPSSLHLGWTDAHRLGAGGLSLAIALALGMTGSAAAQPGSSDEAPALPVGGQKANPPAPTPGADNVAPVAMLPGPFTDPWYDTIRYGFQIEGGFVLNPRQGGDSLNFGQLTTDRVNVPLLNGLQFTVERVIDPAQTDYDLGFSFQILYGSDGRYLHYPGQFSHIIDARNQFVLRTANVTAHLPWLTPGGIDIKAGEYASPVGFEPYDPALSPFYSHSYIFNWGVPGFHTGLLATIHLNPTIDIWAGADTGTNTGIGVGFGDNNRAGAGIVGIGLNGLLDGKLTVLAISHIGSETPEALSPTANRDTRYYNDLVLTYKISDTLSITSEFNYVNDTAIDAQAYGNATYISHVINPDLTFNMRGEIWRDDKGYFVAGFPRNLDPIRALSGQSNSAFAIGPATYTEVTAGLTYRPKLEGPVGFALRPELRYDRVLDARPFNNGRSRDAFTAAMDIILNF